MNKDMKKLATLVGASLAASVSVSSANADANPFGLTDMSGGYEVSQFLGDKGKEGKCGEGKCGEGKKKDKEGKCGEGKCGEGKKGKEGKCGEGKCGEGKKGKEGKCGEGKCGA